MAIRGSKVGQAYIEVTYDLDSTNFVKQTRLAAERTAKIFGKEHLDAVRKSIEESDHQFTTSLNKHVQAYQKLQKQREAAAAATNRKMAEDQKAFEREWVASQNRIAKHTATIAKQVESDHALSDAYAREGHKAATAFTRQADADFKKAVMDGLGPRIDLKRLRKSLNDADVDIDHHGRRWDTGLRKHLRAAFEGVLSILPARLENVFTRTGPIIGTALAVAIGAGLAIALPAVVTGVVGAAITTVGLGAVAAGIALAADDPRIKKAGQKVKETFLGSPATGTKAVASAQKQVDAARKRVSDIEMFGARVTKGKDKGQLTPAAIRARAKALNDEAIAMQKLAAAQKNSKKATTGSLKEAARKAFVGPTVNALGEIQKSLEKNMPHITNILKASAKFIPVITKGVTGFVDALMPALDMLVSSPFMMDLMKIFAEGLIHIGQAISDFFTRLLADPAAMRGVKEGFEDFMNAIASAIRLTGDFARTMAHLWNFMNDHVFPVLRVGWQQYRNFLNEIIGFHIIIISWLINHWTPFADFWRNLWTSIASWFRNTWTNEIAETARNAWTNIANFFRTAWTNIAEFFRGTWTAIASFFRNTWTNIWGFAKGIWFGILGVAISVWSSIRGAITGQINAVRVGMFTILEQIRTKWNSVWGGIKDILSSVWNGITGAVASGINSVIGILNKGISGINFVLEKIGVKFRVPAIGLVGAPSGSPKNNKGKESGPILRARGGAIYGPGSSVSDSIPARLSNGEFVVNAKQTARHRQLLEAINAGGPGFAQGGFTYPGIIALAQKSGIPNHPGSTFRPGSRAPNGNLDYHSSGMAVDFMGFNQDALASFFYAMNTLEVIHHSLRTGRVYAKYNGRPGSLVPGHENHLHVAMSAAQIANPGAGAGGISLPGFAFLGKGWNWVMNKMLGPAVAKMTDKIPGGNIPSEIMKGSGIQLGKQIVGKAKDEFAAMTKMFNSMLSINAAGNPDMAAFGGGARRWSGIAMQALGMLGLPGSWLNPLLTLIQRESGGNPFAINRTDINAQRGDPSRGLMQTIGATFNAYRMPGFGNIFGPLDNILAGLRYIKSRYGSIFNVQQAVGATPRGYRNGGILPPGGLGINETTRPEFVFNERQLGAMGGPYIENLVVHVGGSVTQAEAKKIAKQIRDEIVNMSGRNGGRTGLHVKAGNMSA